MVTKITNYFLSFESYFKGLLISWVAFKGSVHTTPEENGGFTQKKPHQMFYEKGGQTIVDVENVTRFILVLHEISNKDNDIRLPILTVVSGHKLLLLLILELFAFFSLQ